jgi:Flp pilus assembly protein TadG
MPATSGPQSALSLGSVAASSPGAGNRAGLLRRFCTDRSGAVGMMFGLLVIPLTAVVGLAVDYGRAYAVKSHTQAALDSAALAAGRVAQLDKSSSSLTNAENAAKAYFDETKPLSVVSSTMQFSPNSQKTEFTVTATSWVRTPFLGVLQILFSQGANAGAPAGCSGSFFSCVSMTTTATAKFSAGLNGGSNVELALMLDVTGSMCSPCSKIADLKAAAKDLIDIVVWDDQSTYTSKIALAPFAAAVNVGTTLAPLVRGVPIANTSSTPESFTTTSVLNDTSKQPTKKWIRFKKASGSSACGSTNCTWQTSSKCVTERVGPHASTDAPPSTAFVGKGYFGTNTDTSCGVANYADPEVNSIQPLSSDRTMLKGRIDKLATGGSTAGHLGTAWAFYLLSPDWNYLFPLTSQAGPYSDLTNMNTNATPPAPKLKKIAVLMTDGEYNINYCKGVEAQNSNQSPDIACNSENGKSLVQAGNLCTSMKNAKIEVFTVGFQVNSTAKDFLKNCATDASHFYDATTGDALKQAFRDIALKAIPLQLSQ